MPAAKKPLSREARIYLAIWRKAFRERNSPHLPAVEITAANYNMAISMRQGMYRAIRPFRYGEMFDSELNLAPDLFVVVLPKIEKSDRGKPCKLVLVERKNLGYLEAELLNLGLDEADLLTQEEKMVNQSLEKLMQPEPTPVLKVGSRISQTPFYTREK